MHVMVFHEDLLADSITDFSHAEEPLDWSVMHVQVFHEDLLGDSINGFSLEEVVW